MSTTTRFGIWLALIGTLTLTPDALFMRLSGMNGFQMAAWRGLLMGGVMILGWLIFSRTRRIDLAVLRTGPGIGIVVCQFFNSILFCLGIALAPAMVVLLGVATVPVFAALFAWMFMGERASLATWITILAVMAGIVFAVSDDNAGGVALDRVSALGALFGLGVAVVLATNFVVLRAQPQVPIPLAIGLGALVAGSFGLWITGPEAMMQGEVWAMALTGGLVLPLSFFLLSLASRHTQAANVSLLMLLETVLGPLWVWLGIGEEPTARMIIGGIFVVVVLALYLLAEARRKSGPKARVA